MKHQSIFTLLLVIAISLTQTQSSTGVVEVNLKMSEENQEKMTIGSIFNELPEAWKQTDLTYMSDSKFFQVTPNGEVRVVPKLDLENMCSSHSICCGLMTCQLETNILVKGSMDKYLGKILLRVTLEDRNDNQPIFEATSQTVYISENEPVGTEKTLIPAVDDDILEENRVVSYSIKGSQDVFELDSTNMPNVAIRLKTPLDYEVKSKYEITLEACDPGKCAIQNLIVQVRDKNDNIPKFEKDLYEKFLKEDIMVGSKVEQVTALDADSGDFGRIEYTILSRDSNLKKTFQVDRNTGNIILRKKLSASVRERYEFSIRATNPIESPSGKPNTTRVIFKIEDLNDNRPIIHIVSPSGKIEMAEGTLPKQIAMFRVEDKDLNINAVVTCKLLENDQRNSFQLQDNGGNIYALSTTRTFDYELEQKAVATIECSDKGSPPLTSRRDITLLISDVNEFVPKFVKNIYPESIHENTKEGMEVVTVSAEDDDLSAQLVYSLGNQDQDYFSINPTTGTIRTTNVPLDRELVEHVKFRVYVVDSPMNSKTATAVIDVKVVDVNDNSPHFISGTYFDVEENVKIRTQLIGQLDATDADADSDKRIKFSLRNTWSKGQSLSAYFDVTEQGKIETIQELDREIYDTFTLQVEARDQGQPSRFTLQNITVNVRDVNDHKPVWTYPRDRDNVINISASVPPGELVVQVRARDEDSGLNGKISFLIIDQSSGFLKMNSTTGQLTVAKELTQGQIKLKLRAQDQSMESKFTDTKLIINVQGGVTLNFTVIVIMITVTAVISLFLVVAIICVRRSPWSGHSASPPASEVAKDHLAAAWAYHHEDQPCPDNASVIYFPTHGMSPDNTMSMHTFGRAGGERLMPLGSMGQHPEAVRYFNGDSRGIPFEPLDGDSADSGRGASEDEPHHYNTMDKGRPFSPIQFHNRPPSRASLRARVTSPIPASNCQCYILPEDGIIQAGQSPMPGYLRGQTHACGSSQGMTDSPTVDMPPPMMPLTSPGTAVFTQGGMMMVPPPAYDTNSISRSPRRPYGGMDMMDDGYRTTGVSPFITRPRVINNPVSEISDQLPPVTMETSMTASDDNNLQTDETEELMAISKSSEIPVTTSAASTFKNAGSAFTTTSSLLLRRNNNNNSSENHMISVTPNTTASQI